MRAIRSSIGRRYCPLGTREALHQEIRGLRKTRNLSVEEYDAEFLYLLDPEEWILPDDGGAMTTTDQFRHDSAGMPQTWRMQVIPQHSRWDNLEKLKTRYL
ncbi:hypothetical protein GN244_ATG12387 [Phytophthora infestans]|uniref:Retrotransposon gag domain-containing protein n=1 Tax=Phytophthora infestans TaxID=4787 RepID=A0A833T015_PHYIN|nr:hypothetical protein GN244_ATG12387 [Phytophthora infestans]KAF4139327.1 hypothetical protein GN958_ATG11474 [Phytophthora infestans]